MCCKCDCGLTVSFLQVVSLDEEGKLLFWSVIALQDDDDDIFLSYGGRLKLLRVASSSIHKDASMNQREKSWTLPLARSRHSCVSTTLGCEVVLHFRAENQTKARAVAVVLCHSSVRVRC